MAQIEFKIILVAGFLFAIISAFSVENEQSGSMAKQIPAPPNGKPKSPSDMPKPPSDMPKPPKLTAGLFRRSKMDKMKEKMEEKMEQGKGMAEMGKGMAQSKAEEMKEKMKEKMG